MMARYPKSIEKPSLVIVEGNDDQELIQRMLKELQLADQIQCWQAGSKSDMEQTLADLHLLPGFGIVKAIAIIADADKDPAKTFKDIEGYLKVAALPETIAVTIHTVPEGKPGMLEDVCIASVVTDAVMPCIDSFLLCIEATVEELPRNPSKSRFLAFMASRPKATNGTVEAALQRGYFPLSHEAFAPIRAILTGLVSS